MSCVRIVTAVCTLAVLPARLPAPPKPKRTQQYAGAPDQQQQQQQQTNQQNYGAAQFVQPNYAGAQFVQQPPAGGIYLPLDLTGQQPGNLAAAGRVHGGGQDTSQYA